MTHDDQGTCVSALSTCIYMENMKNHCHSDDIQEASPAR
jgi:hypothetical protein